ncbi:hypothetical protein ACMGDE_08660 [Parapedobacter sp. DT-150]
MTDIVVFTRIPLFKEHEVYPFAIANHCELKRVCTVKKAKYFS